MLTARRLAERAINNVLNPGSAGKTPASNVGSPGAGTSGPISPRNNPVGGSDSNSKFSQGARANRDDSLVGRLMFSKGISAFLQAPETQMCEFWNLW